MSAPVARRSLRDRGKLAEKNAARAAAELGNVVRSAGVLLAHDYYKDGAPNPRGWWLSEKLDGVRAYWNGVEFCSRNGAVFAAPAFFTASLPKDTHLDGELWCGREQVSPLHCALSSLFVIHCRACNYKNDSLIRTYALHHHLLLVPITLALLILPPCG
jgi:ATP-dependent DNA ligase